MIIFGCAHHFKAKLTSLEFLKHPMKHPTETFQVGCPKLIAPSGPSRSPQATTGALSLGGGPASARILTVNIPGDSQRNTWFNGGILLLWSVKLVDLVDIWWISTLHQKWSRNIRWLSRGQTEDSWILVPKQLEKRMWLVVHPRFLSTKISDRFLAGPITIYYPLLLVLRSLLDASGLFSINQARP
jgi:hypothetical protein